MRSVPFIACAAAATLLAACVTRTYNTSPVAVVPATAPVATAQANTLARTGQVVAVENSIAAPSSSVPVSGSSGGRAAASETARVTVRFADGTETAYDVQQPVSAFRVGDPINVITRGNSIVVTR